MTHQAPRPSPLRFAPLLALCTLASVLAACSTSYVVLLPNDDGTVGKVQVTGPDGTNLLTQPLQAAKVSAPSGTTYVATAEEVKAGFGAALSASPKRPKNYILYFEAGGAVLTAESQQTLAKVQEEIEARAVPDISVTGHTDTSGDAAQNLALGLERARQIRSLLTSAKLGDNNVTIESHGEKNLLVATPDNTDEPRNRRVEVTVR
jgi:peptidoglycan-associated lipoprotein